MTRVARWYAGIAFGWLVAAVLLYFFLDDLDRLFFNAAQDMINFEDPESAGSLEALLTYLGVLITLLLVLFLNVGAMAVMLTSPFALYIAIQVIKQQKELSNGRQEVCRE